MNRFIACVSAIATTALLLGFSSGVQAAAGRTPGSFAIGSTGAATYDVPLWTPPGIGSIHPSFSLHYNSQKPDGIMGVGWTLTGLSAITRCSMTYAQDGTTNAVTLTQSDRLCLDGKRLRVTGGVYGQAGATYQTEIADFSNVISSGTAGNGPASFEVWSRNGLIYEYGTDVANTHSQLMLGGGSTVRTWALSRIRDRSGNYARFIYTQDTAHNTYRIAEVDYPITSGGQGPYTRVVFTYADRASLSHLSRFSAGYESVETKVLGAISIQSMTSMWETLKTYTLSYDSPINTRHTRLIGLQECSLYSCLAASVFSYQNGTNGWAAKTATAQTKVPSSPTYPGDFDGDGFNDLLFAKPYGNWLHWWLLRGSASGYVSAPFDTTINTLPTDHVFVADFVGEGPATFLYPTGNWMLMKFDGSTFSYQDTGLSSASQQTTVIGDADGDGLPDILSVPDQSNLKLFRNTTTGTRPRYLHFDTTGVAVWHADYDSAQRAAPTYVPWGNAPVQAADFNGDGRTDIVMTLWWPSVFESPVYQEILYSSGPSSNPVYVAGPTVTSCCSGYNSNQTPLPPPPVFADWNGDGCTDLLTTQTTTSNWNIQLSTCSTSNPWFAAPVDTGVPASAFLEVVDWDGDDHPDLLWNNGGTVYVGSWAPDVGMFQNTTGIPTSDNCSANTDIDGDGQTDLICADSSNTISYRLHNGVLPDLATSFTDGFGVNASPAYAALARSPNYQLDLSQQFPEIHVVLPIPVVTQATASNGIGGTYTQTISYQGAIFNAQGRGFEGFTDTTLTDSRNGFATTTLYNTKFPLTGSVYVELVRATGGAPAGQTYHYYNSRVLDSTAGNTRYAVYPDNDLVHQWEIGGPRNTQPISTTATTYTFDNWGNATSIAVDTTDNDTTSPNVGLHWTSTTTALFTPDTANWCLGQPTQVTISNTAPGVPTLTRTAQGTPDYIKCRPTQKVAAPGTQYAVTENFGYDSFGNLNSRSVTGNGMATRTSTADYGTRGQFPVTQTNALGHSNQYGYNYSYGVMTSVTDPNGITTTASFDEFLHKTWQWNPDGTAVSFSYVDCATDGCVNANNRVTANVTTLNVDSSVQTRVAAYLDALERPLVTKSMLLDGTYTRTETQYDVFGNVARRSAPCAWSSCTPYWTTYTYDGRNRAIQVQRPVNAANSGTLQTTTVQYAGRTVTTTDAEGKQQTSVLNVLGALVRAQDHNGYAQNFTYDAFGSLLSVVDSQSNSLFSATYEYGADAFQRTATDADLGARTQTFDALGELIQYTDAKGQQFSISYDPLSRPLQRVEPDLTTNWYWGTSAAAFNIGQLTSVTAGSYAEAYTFDNRGRRASKTITIPSDGQYTYTYLFDSNTGLLDSVTYPTSTASYRLKLKYSYQNGLLKSISDFNVPSKVFWTANTTNVAGQITQETLGNGVVTNRAFDAVTGWLSTVQTGLNGTATLQNDAYLFDRVGNTIQRQNNNSGLTENFYYDNLHRLDHSTLGGTTNLAVQYDSMGNIVSRSDVSGGATWTYDATKKHAVIQAGSSALSYSYDPNGNALTRGSTTITWTSFNHPAAINTGSESIQFSYTQDHQRWRTVYSGTNGVETTYFIGGAVEKVATAGNTDFRHYIFAGGSKVAVYSRTSAGATTLRYIREDHLGSVSGLLNEDGSSYVKEAFSAFGARRDTCTWSGPPTDGQLQAINAVSRRGFTWHSAMGDMGLNDMNGRIEDTVIGRFLSADPYLEDPADTQAFNRYSYVHNNPLSFTDPSGFFGIGPCYDGQIWCGNAPCDFGICDITNPPLCPFCGAPDTPDFPDFPPTKPPKTPPPPATPPPTTPPPSTPTTPTTPPSTPTTPSTPDQPAQPQRDWKDVVFAPWNGWSSFKSALADFVCLHGCEWPGPDGPMGMFQALGPSGGPLSNAGEGSTLGAQGGMVAKSLGDTVPKGAAFAEAVADHIVLGLKNFGLKAVAEKVGGRTLLADDNWMQTLKNAIHTPGTRFTVSVEGLSGADVQQKVLTSVMRGLGTRGGYTDWELAQLYQAGKMKDVTFVNGLGEVLANPF